MGTAATVTYSLRHGLPTILQCLGLHAAWDDKMNINFQSGNNNK